MDMSQLPPSHPPIDGMNHGHGQMPARGRGQPADVDRSGRTGKTGPLEQFLVAKFIIPGTAMRRRRSTSAQLAGDGGGLLPNVNRWRAQLGQPPVTRSGRGQAADD